MEFKVEGSRRNKKFIEAILPSMFRQLKLENSTKGVVIRVADECGSDSGITVDLSRATGCYMVVIKPHRNLKEIGLTLAHEMVHVKQMAKGILKSTKNGAHLWAGKRYHKNTEYLDRPWEIEAFSKQELILRRAIED
jgi:hypothetical protein